MRHGSYTRKAPHQTADTAASIRVPRFYCPPCRATHSILPNDLPPLCRWRWRDILTLSPRFSLRESLHGLARGFGETRASLRRLRDWIPKAAAVVACLVRETLAVALPPRPAPAEDAQVLFEVRRFPTWDDFARLFSRAFYPRRALLFGPHTIRTG